MMPQNAIITGSKKENILENIPPNLSTNDTLGDFLSQYNQNKRYLIQYNRHYAQNKR
jgi:hypothetical protein